MNAQVERWLKNENLQNFLRQAHVDMHVGLKNGVKEAEVNATIQEFLTVLDDHLRPTLMERQADGSFKGTKLGK